jgi:hypothetical protein
VAKSRAIAATAAVTIFEKFILRKKKKETKYF